jgi:hypothetical protein
VEHRTPTEAPTGATTATRPRWIEIVATVLLSMAAVATAWSSYQAARWNAEQAETFSAANAARVESTASSDLGNSQTQIDIALFMQWVDAGATGHRSLARFYRDRFRPEFRPAFDAWIATEPFRDPSAPSSPFSMTEYTVAAKVQATELLQQADALAAEARNDVQHATNYVLGVVVFAVSLFFAGVSTKLPSTRAQAIVVVIGCLLFTGAVVWIATFPINLVV